MPENAGFRCGIKCPSGHNDAAGRTSSGQGEWQTAKGRLLARIPSSQEVHQVTRTVSNSHEGTDRGQETALSGLKCAPKADNSFAFDFHHSYFWSFNAICGHFMSF